MVSPCFAGAQYHVKGRILRADSTIPKSVSLKLFPAGEKTSRQALLTDSVGRFHFSLPDSGTYEISINSIFYKDTTIRFILLTQQVGSKDLGDIILMALTKALSNVTVVATRQPVELRDDHILYNPAADPTAGSRPLTEILNRIPGIAVDGKNQIMAKGQEGVQVLVNGRAIRSSAGDYLAQLNADEVERVEVYDNATRFSYIKSSVVI
ncbi:MAG: TonB-dependent receptor plug domain-containing protein, partial [Chitinophagaceae bacterium]